MISQEEFDNVWFDLVSRRHSRVLTALNEHERVFYALNLLRGKVARSGFIGVFQDTESCDILLAYDALELLKLQNCIPKLMEAQKIVLGDQVISKESILPAVFPDTLTPEEQDFASDKMELALVSIEEQFLTYDTQIYEALSQYAAKHNLTKMDTRRSSQPTTAPF